MGLTEEQMIEALRRNNEAINRGDFDAAIELADPDIVFVRAGALPDLHGADAVRAWMEPDAFESQTYEMLDHEVSGNRILVRSLSKARGAGSGIEMELVALTVWTFNDAGRITRVEIFFLDQEDEARRALHAP
jgi:ketosteroid isomerase-like protein